MKTLLHCFDLLAAYTLLRIMVWIGSFVGIYRAGVRLRQKEPSSWSTVLAAFAMAFVLIDGMASLWPIREICASDLFSIVPIISLYWGPSIFWLVKCVRANRNIRRINSNKTAVED